MQNDDITSSVKDATRAIKRNVDDGAEAVVSAYGDVQSVGGEFQRAIKKSMKEEPYATIIMAAAMGFVLGAIWRM